MLTPRAPGAPGAQRVSSSGPWRPARGLTLGRLLDEVAGILSRCDPPTRPSKTSEIFAEGLSRAKICPVLQITCEQNRHYPSLPLCSLLFPTPARPSYSSRAPGPPCPSEPLLKPTSSRKPSQPASVLPGPCFISLYPTVASPRLISMPLPRALPEARGHPQSSQEAPGSWPVSFLWLQSPCIRSRARTSLSPGPPFLC